MLSIGELSVIRAALRVSINQNPGTTQANAQEITGPEYGIRRRCLNTDRPIEQTRGSTYMRNRGILLGGTMGKTNIAELTKVRDEIQTTEEG
jgi:hypothetical protein